ncbi:phage tail tube protein [Paracoccus sp. (in: a-proteobacteria)]|uniref:phage tail tube protein n=1 Tax=Paracoccus sp. TaxID=267 RepID=UPI0028973C9C|nr:phage tail tube protein [Paracoccus sp. (in: a-proteobacteria)]
MAERYSQADVSWDDQLYVGRFASGGGEPTFTQIYGIENLPMPERAPEDLDMTHQQSPGRSRETKPGLMAAADYSLDKQLWAEDEGDLLLDELAGLSEAGTEEMVLIEFVVAGIRRTYRGYVNAYTPQAPVGEKRPVSVAFKIFNRVTPDPRPLPPVGP